MMHRRSIARPQGSLWGDILVPCKINPGFIFRNRSHPIISSLEYTHLVYTDSFLSACDSDADLEWQFLRLGMASQSLPEFAVLCCAAQPYDTLCLQCSGTEWPGQAAQPRDARQRRDEHAQPGAEKSRGLCPPIPAQIHRWRLVLRCWFLPVQYETVRSSPEGQPHQITCDAPHRVRQPKHSTANTGSID